MGFDVDSCACGYDGQRVLVCPRTAIALAYQANTIDMTRRSPSYEMRLAKYAERGFEVLVPPLVRARVDPFLFENIDEEVDPMLDPVLEKQVVIESGQKFIQLGDKKVDWSDDFQLFFTTK